MRSDLRKAIDSFRMRNKRSPTSAERQRIAQFLSTESAVDEISVTAAQSEEAQFEREMASALRGVRELGRRHRLHFACALIDIFAESNDGRHPNADEMAQMFSSIVARFSEEANAQTDGDDSECESEGEGDDFSEQFDSAIEHIRDLGAHRQPAMVDRICNIFAASSGMEATLQNLSEMFESIKASFVSEEKEDLLGDSGASAGEDIAEESNRESSFADSESECAESDLDYSQSESEEDGDAESEEESASSAFAESDDDESEQSLRDRDSGDGKDSEYDPDRDTFDYCRDIEEDHLGSSDGSEDEESESAY